MVKYILGFTLFRAQESVTLSNFTGGLIAIRFAQINSSPPLSAVACTVTPL